ncbi:DUF2796 domain-containing protein [Simiduia litorea]|uniref:ZrgA family zinc uptake protein n=1 Tax=Simiduia litorea TaxID=1435348 RepID=UPI0036F3A542
MRALLGLVTVGLCCFCRQGIAENRHNPEAHIHGVAQMTILSGDGKLLIDFETPAANMLGFERRPQSAEQWQQLSLVEKSLHSPNNIIDLQPDCKIQMVKIELPFQAEEKMKKVPDPTVANHRRHTHDAQIADGAAVDSLRDEPAHATHQDIRFSYAWQCNASASLTISLTLLFNRFRGFEKIQAQWVANGTQGATLLTRDHAVLEI